MAQDERLCTVDLDSRSPLRSKRIARRAPVFVEAKPQPGIVLDLPSSQLGAVLGNLIYFPGSPEKDHKFDNPPYVDFSKKGDPNIDPNLIQSYSGDPTKVPLSIGNPYMLPQACLWFLTLRPKPQTLEPGEKGKERGNYRDYTDFIGV